ELTPRVFELSELLVRRLGVEDVGASFHHRVTFHPTCHSLRLLEVGDAPLRLLRAVRGIDLVELPSATECCGFGGTFAVKNADVAEVPDWEALRDAGAEIKERALRHLDVHLEGLEAAVQRAGGTVHWARDGAEACTIVAGIAREHGSDEVIKVKSLATDEIGLN